METILKTITILCTVVIMSCTGGGGGVTTENTPNPGGGATNPVAPVFSENLSSLLTFDHNGNQASSDLMGEQFKAVFVAKDTNGNPFTTLTNISVVVMENQNPATVQEVSLINQGNGTYEALFSSAEPKTYSFKLKLGSVISNDFLLFNVSACSNEETAVSRDLVLESVSYKVICNTPQLLAIQSNMSGKYILGKSIDLSAYYIDLNSDWIPDNQFQFGPAPFTGVLKGLGTVPPAISGYRYNGEASSQSNLGLFKEISAPAAIENIKVEQFYISGNSTIGGLASAINAGSTIKDVSVSGSVSGKSFLGAIAGKIESNSASEKVLLNSVSGELSLFILSQSSGGNNNIGGITGLVQGNVEINNSTASLVVSQDSATSLPVTSVGGVAGSILGSSSPQNLIPKIQDLKTSSANIRIRNGSKIGGVSGEFHNAEFLRSITNLTGMDSQVAFFLSANINQSPTNGAIGGFSGSVLNSNVKNLSIFLSTSGSDDPLSTGDEKITSAFNGFSKSINSSLISTVSLFSFNMGIKQSNFSLFADAINDSQLEKISTSFLNPLIVEDPQINTFLFANRVENSSLKRSNLQVNTEFNPASSKIALIGEVIDSEVSDTAIYTKIVADSDVAGVSLFAQNSIIKNLLIQSDIRANSNVFGVAKEIENTQISAIAQVSKIVNLSGSGAPVDSSLAIQKSDISGLSNLTDFVYFKGNTDLLAYCLDSSCSNASFSAQGEILESYFYNKENNPYLSWDFNNVWESDEDLQSYPYLKR